MSGLSNTFKEFEFHRSGKFLGKTLPCKCQMLFNVIFNCQWFSPFQLQGGNLFQVESFHYLLWLPYCLLPDIHDGSFKTEDTRSFCLSRITIASNGFVKTFQYSQTSWPHCFILSCMSSSFLITFLPTWGSFIPIWSRIILNGPLCCISTENSWGWMAHFTSHAGAFIRGFLCNYCHPTGVSC